MAFEPDCTPYRLVDGRPEPEPDLLAWAAWFESADRHVAETFVTTGAVEIRVSTAFLGIDLGRHEGPPLLWETIVFGGPDHGRCRQYSGEGEALAGHREEVAACSASTESRELRD